MRNPFELIPRIQALSHGRVRTSCLTGVVLLLVLTPPVAASEPQGLLTLADALLLTLERDPNIAILDSRTRAAEGSLERARSVFDLGLTASVSGSDLETPTGIGLASTQTERLRQTLGLDLLLRSGLRLSPAVELESNEIDGGAALSDATVSLGLRQPLLRGRGRRVTTAGEDAADADLEASRLDLAHTVDLRVRAVASSYWSAVEALRDLEVLETTEASSRQLLGTIGRLIDADVIPSAERVQLEADLVTKEANRIAGEQAALVARQALGREIGLEAAEIAALGRPDAPFPTSTENELARLGAVASFVEVALERRRDLRAARSRVGAARLRVTAAEDRLKSRLDLVLTPSYSGLASGRSLGDLYSPLYDNVPGLSTTLRLDFSRPLENRDAEGALMQAQAFLDEASLLQDLVRYAVGADVPVALAAVERGASQLARTEEAVLLFERAVDNEEKKLRAGSSTLIDVISQRDRLTDARRRHVAAQAALARALVELRFQTGTLLADGSPELTLTSTDVTTIPRLEDLP